MNFAFSLQITFELLKFDLGSCDSLETLWERAFGRFDASDSEALNESGRIQR